MKRILLARSLAQRLAIAILASGFAALPVYAQTPPQRLPTSSAKQGSSVEILSPTEGVDFGAYIANLTFKVREVWYADMPKEVYLGAKGRCSVTFIVTVCAALEVPASCEPNVSGPAGVTVAAASTGLCPGLTRRAAHRRKLSARYFAVLQGVPSSEAAVQTMPGTPAGVYPLTVTGTTAGATWTINLTLTVQ